MAERPTFVFFGLDAHARELIAKACPNAPWVELAPLDKGLSGSMVLMARWSISGANSKFHVFKIGDPSKLAHEYNAIRDVAAPLVKNFPHVSYHVSNDGKKAILSQEFLGESDGSTRSLRQYIEKSDNEDGVVDIIQRLYTERLIDWHPEQGIARQMTSAEDELQPWIRKGNLQKACNDIGSVGIEASLETNYGLNLKKLQRLVNRVLKSPLEVDKGPVHGDLHSQNILVDRARRISLIDFGWTAIRWRAVDYLWLECSLKFVVASPYASVDDLLAIEELLDAAWIEDKPLDTSLLDGRLLSQDLKKIAAGVAAIRAEARAQLDKMTLSDYRKGLIAMSYALTTFPELNLVYLMHSLARNARSIELDRDDQGPYHRLYAAAEVLWPDRPGRMVRKAAEIAAKPGKALDIGCGDGKDVLHLEDRKWKVTGIDISQLAVDAAEKRFSRYYGKSGVMRSSISRANAVTYDYPASAYDLVIAYGLYHCLDDDELMAVHTGAVKALKPGGLFAFAAFNDRLPVPDDHHTGEMYLRDESHIFELARDDLELIEHEIGEIEEDHAPMVAQHRHSLTWALFRKR